MGVSLQLFITCPQDKGSNWEGGFKYNLPPFGFYLSSTAFSGLLLLTSLCLYAWNAYLKGNTVAIESSGKSLCNFSALESIYMVLHGPWPDTTLSVSCAQENSHRVTGKLKFVWLTHVISISPTSWELPLLHPLAKIPFKLTKTMVFLV